MGDLEKIMFLILVSNSKITSGSINRKMYYKNKIGKNVFGRLDLI